MEKETFGKIYKIVQWRSVSSEIKFANNDKEVLGDQKRPYLLWVAGLFVGFKDQLELELTLTSLNILLDIDTLIITSNDQKHVLAITFDYIRDPFDVFAVLYANPRMCFPW